MDSFSLQGLTVAITSSRRASELAHLIEALGGKAYLAPTVGIQVSRGETANQIERFLALASEGPGIDVSIFMTGPGVESIVLVSKELGVHDSLIQKLRKIPLVIARSEKPKSVLSKYGIVGNVKVPRQATVKGIEDLLTAHELKEKKLAVFWHGDRSEHLVDFLKNVGTKVVEFTTYSYSNELSEEGTNLLRSAGFARAVSPEKERISKLIDDLIDGKVDAIMFTSPPAVKNLFVASGSRREELRLALDRRVLVVCIGPSTSEMLASYGVSPDVVPEVYKMGKMVESLAEYLQGDSRARKKIHAFV